MMWKEIVRSVLKWSKGGEDRAQSYIVSMACYTHTGLVRAHNEDNFSFDGTYMEEEHQSLEEVLCLQASSRENPAAALFDGMGGESAGEKASFSAARTFTQLCGEESWDQDRLSFIVHRMNEAVCREKAAGRYDSIGCTVAIAAFSGTQMFCANLGDSPIYLYRNGQLMQMSVPHTDEALLKEQGITGRKPGLTQFLGIEEEEYVIVPQVSETEIRAGDIYLLCSDGLTDMCSEDEIAGILSRKILLDGMIKQLTDTALEHGGRDNITIILCRAEREK